MKLLCVRNIKPHAGEMEEPSKIVDDLLSQRLPLLLGFQSLKRHGRYCRRPATPLCIEDGAFHLPQHEELLPPLRLHHAPGMVPDIGNNLLHFNR